MTTLFNFQMLSQLTDYTSDGQISENKLYDCVPTCLCAGAMYLLGKTQMDDTFNADNFKDKVYGQGYLGGTAASAYVEYLHTLGVHLYPVNGNPASLVQQAHQCVQHWKPVLYTEPDPYVPAYLGWTHVLVFFSEQPGMLTALDPYIDAPITRFDAEWANSLQFGQIWIEERANMIPSGWKDDGKILTAPNGVPVVLGFRDFVLSHTWDPQNYPLESEQSVPQVEASNPGLGGGSRQTFRYDVLIWTPQRGMYRSWVGQEVLKLRQMVVPLK